MQGAKHQPQATKKWEAMVELRQRVKIIFDLLVILSKSYDHFFSLSGKGVEDDEGAGEYPERGGQKPPETIVRDIREKLKGDQR